MRVAEGVEALDLPMEFMGGPSVIHPTLVWDDRDVILIDTGMPGQLETLREACRNAGAPLERLTRIILTHQDIDHIGGLPELLAALDQDVEVLAHPLDRPYIEGQKTPIKMNPERMAERIKDLPADRRAPIEAMMKNPPHARVDRTIDDGEELPYCGGITVIHTPGHTPGHVSLFLKRSRTLVTGDAMVAEDGRLQGPRAAATPDMDTALRSLRKLAPLDVDKAITYHGGVVRAGAKERLQELTRAS